MHFVAPRQLVFPGDLIATGGHKVEGPVYVDSSGRYRSLVIGLVEFRGSTIIVVPLEGTYRPRAGDLVVGYVTDVLGTGWEVDAKSFMPAYLPVSEALHRHVDLETTPLTALLNVGDVVIAKIKDVDLTEEYPIILTLKEEKLGKVESGTVIEITPVRVPRVIGKKGSMLNALSRLGCTIAVGQNGRVWVKCKDVEDEAFLAAIVKKIERESHVMGLTDRVRAEIEEYLSSKQR
jgi:exosome complex component RRP4